MLFRLEFAIHWLQICDIDLPLISLCLIMSVTDFVCILTSTERYEVIFLRTKYINGDGGNEFYMNFCEFFS